MLFRSLVEAITRHGTPETLASLEDLGAEAGTAEAREQGMLTLREDGWAKAQLGYTSVEEILRVVA